MSLADTLLPEFDMEMGTTRRVLERVPSEQGEWKPHPKSFALGHLTQLVATMPGWLIRMLGDTHIDLAGQSGYSFQSTDSLLAQFDKLVRDARTSIEAARDEQLGEPWSLMRGGTVLFTSPRGTVVRTHVNHMVHHRGQLTVYLRLLDVPVPSIYGPTADEPW